MFAEDASLSVFTAQKKMKKNPTTPKHQIIIKIKKKEIKRFEEISYFFFLPF
jgi:hypothetical protein